MRRNILCLLLVMLLVLSSASCSTMEPFFEDPDKQTIPIETVDYDDSKSVWKYLYSLRGLCSSNKSNQSEYPTLDHLQYLYFYEGKGIYNCSILVDYSHDKLLYDYIHNMVISYPKVPENIRELTEEDIVGIQSLLDEQDIFSWGKKYDGTGGVTYEGYWVFSLLFDDGSAFVTSGQGDYEAA